MVVADAARRAGWHILGFLDDQLNAGTEIDGSPVLGDGYSASEHNAAVIIAIGDNRLRWEKMNRLVTADVEFATVIHPTAVVSQSAAIGPGTFVGPTAVINPLATVGRGAIINSGAIVEHHTQVETAAHIAPGAVLAGRAFVGTRSLIGARAVVLPGILVAEDVVVGAGAVVTRPISSGSTVVGAPARPR
jgi:sugar O-acyltransferase (sialic acid O-acetyltransferase NeuD family)